MPCVIRNSATAIARAVDSSQLVGKRGVLIGTPVGVAVDLEHPGQLGRDLADDLLERAGQLGQLVAAARLDVGRAAGEQHLRLEHEPVADDPHVLAVAQGPPQLAEELRAVLRQLLDLAGQRDVEPLAEFGDRARSARRSPSA